MRVALTTVFLFGLCAGLAVAQAPIPISGFEFQAPGQLMSATPDAEGWVLVGGTCTVLPNGTGVTGPCATGLPIDGSSQWCEILPDNVGPANPVVPPSTPTTYSGIRGGPKFEKIRP